MPPQSALITVMTKAAHRAARHLKRDFGEVENLQVSRKGPADFVSNADLKAEEVLREELSKARPTYGFLLEEGGALQGSDPTRRWIIDPLDGTSNFLHALPHWAISIALEEQGSVIAGVIYDPIKDEIFTAEKGGGAFLNNRRLRVSARQQLADALLATGIPFKGTDHHQEFLGELQKVMGKVAGVRRWGAAALDLAYVAAGRFDGYWEAGISSWDVAAGVLIVREAGGQVSKPDGQAFHIEDGAILASNGKLHADIQALLS